MRSSSYKHNETVFTEFDVVHVCGLNKYRVSAAFRPLIKLRLILSFWWFKPLDFCSFTTLRTQTLDGTAGRFSSRFHSRTGADGFRKGFLMMLTDFNLSEIQIHPETHFMSL